MGLMLFVLDEPRCCLLRGDMRVFGPTEPYERFGDVNNVVFACGCVLEPDGDTLRLYYGAADMCIGLATASLKGLLDWLKAHGRPDRSQWPEHAGRDHDFSI